MKKTLIIIAVVVVALGLVAWLGLPAGLTAMGLHPQYSGPKFQLPGGKALIIATSHDRLGEKGDRTGVFGSEMTAPYYEFVAGGMKVDLASIKGGPIPIDPMSIKWFIKSGYDDRFLKDPDFQLKTAQSLKIDDSWILRLSSASICDIAALVVTQITLPCSRLARLLLSRIRSRA